MSKRTNIIPKAVAAVLTLGVVTGLFIGLNSANAATSNAMQSSIPSAA